MKEIHQASFRALYAHFQEQRSREHALALCRLVRLSAVDVSSAIREHVLGDDWFDFALESLREHFARARGHIYLTASHDHPGLIKLGKTGRPVADRIRALSRENVLHPFQLLHAVPVHDRHWVELRSHTVLQGQGVLRIKEFFAGELSHMRNCIEGALAADHRLFARQGLTSALPEEETL